MSDQRLGSSKVRLGQRTAHSWAGGAAPSRVRLRLASHHDDGVLADSLGGVAFVIGAYVSDTSLRASSLRIRSAVGWRRPAHVKVR